jgi:hypothetical protein
MAILTTERDAWLNAFLPGASHASYSGNTALYLSLHTADPGNTGASPFVIYSNPGRPAIGFDAAASQAGANTARIDFGITGADTITHIGLWTADSGGTFKGGGALASSKTVADGEILRFEIGAVVVSVA